MTSIIHVVKEEPGTILMLSCLHKCIRKFDKWQNPSDWNELDDVLDVILKRVAFESSNRLTAILLTFVSSITTIPLQKSSVIRKNTNYENLNEIISIVNLSGDERTAIIKQLRNECSKYHNLCAGRWMKKLTEILLQLPTGQPEEMQLHLHVKLDKN